jgi:hypothetical protein
VSKENTYLELAAMIVIHHVLHVHLLEILHVHHVKVDTMLIVNNAELVLLP